MISELEKMLQRVEYRLGQVKTSAEFYALKKEFLGRKGKLTLIFKQIKSRPSGERVRLGKFANETKEKLNELFQKADCKIFKLKAKSSKLKASPIDLTLPGTPRLRGRLHPLTKVQHQAVEIFKSLGFSVAEGPLIETEFYNFDALNIPKDHPARDLWDTFWLQGNQKIPNPKSQLQNKSQAQNSKFKTSGKLLLRTHTSPVQVRYMEKHNPPLRIVVPGRCFRYENPDATHNFEFYHLEGLMVDRAGKVSAAHFKWVIQVFFETFLGKKVEIRLLPDYFPFTEPSFEIGVRLDKKQDWLELAGAGMVHPKVFEAAGLNSNNWQGFAFGMGLERLAMLKYKVNDIRLFFEPDLRILRGFK
jgi:phenylalanyl-tRNA synthetase alpha chain